MTAHTITHNVAMGSDEYTIGAAWWGSLPVPFRKSLMLRSQLHTRRGKLDRDGQRLVASGTWRDFTPRERAVLMTHHRHLIGG